MVDSVRCHLYNYLMTKRDAPFTVGEWYHCYNRTLDKRIAFADAKDYQRFLEILYLANDQTALRRGDLGAGTLAEVLREPRGGRLVTLGAFCLMPGHFHLALRESAEGGVTTFMRKLGTAYTLYFNSRYGREGNFFLKPFLSLHVPLERYPSVVNFVHANPTVLYEPQWRTGHVVDHQFVVEHLMAYPYSSLAAYAGLESPLRPILDAKLLAEAQRPAPIQKMLRDAREYCANRNIP